MLSDYLSLKDAAALCPNKPHVAALWRWARKGIKSKGSGGRIYLRHSRLGAKIYTSEKWLTEFFEAIAVADHAHFASSQQTSTVIKSTPRQREKAVAQAEQELAQAGI